MLLTFVSLFHGVKHLLGSSVLASDDSISDRNHHAPVKHFSHSSATESSNIQYLMRLLFVAFSHQSAVDDSSRYVEKKASTQYEMAQLPRNREVAKAVTKQQVFYYKVIIARDEIGKTLVTFVLLKLRAV